MTPFQISEGIYVAAIFTAKVTHWKKKLQFVRKLYFYLSHVKGDVSGRAEGSQEGSSISFDLKWSVVLLVSLTCYVSYHLGCMLLFLLCVLREFATLIFLAMDTQKHRQGKHAWEQCVGAVCRRSLSGEELTSPVVRPHALIQSYGFLKCTGFAIYQHGGLRPASDVDKEPL